jgi:hypothetical protein
MAARILSALIYLLVGNFRLKLTLWRFIRSVLMPGIMPYLFGYGLMAALLPWLSLLQANRWQWIGILGVLGVAYVLLTAGFFYAFMCGPEEQGQIRQKLRRRRG